MGSEEKVKVLMLDDEKFLLDIYKLTFEKSGYEVVVSTDADQALSILRAGYSPDIILFDITMPCGKSGYEFLDDLQREKLGKGALKIALTNEGQEAEIKRMRELGAAGHLLKASYSPVQLVEAVQELKKRATVAFVL